MLISSRTIPLLTALALSACKGRDKPPRVIQLLPAPESRTSVERKFTDLAPGQCAPVVTVSLRLRGWIGVEERFGPPGFGETPKKDAKLAVPFLHLERPLVTCAANLSDVSLPAETLAVIQLNTDLPTLKGVGPLDVFGWLNAGTGSNDFTRVTLLVDSIPSLRDYRHGGAPSRNPAPAS